MSREDLISVEGVVLEKFPGGVFSVRFGENRTALAHLSGRLRKTAFVSLPATGSRWNFLPTT